MVNALPVSELAVYVPIASKQATAAPPAKQCIMELGNLAMRRLINRVAPEAITRVEDRMIIVSASLLQCAAASDAGP